MGLEGGTADHLPAMAAQDAAETGMLSVDLHPAVQQLLPVEDVVHHLAMLCKGSGSGSSWQWVP